MWKRVTDEWSSLLSPSSLTKPMQLYDPLITVVFIISLDDTMSYVYMHVCIYLFIFI